MMHRVKLNEPKWSLCRNGEGDPEPGAFDSYAKAADYLARRGLRVVGRDTEVRVVYYETDPVD